MLNLLLNHISLNSKLQFDDSPLRDERLPNGEDVALPPLLPVGGFGVPLLRPAVAPVGHRHRDALNDRGHVGAAGQRGGGGRTWKGSRKARHFM